MLLSGKCSTLFQRYQSSINKDSPNDTVKGFDAVHVVVSSQSLQLWLGESKFYEDIGAAIRDAVQSIVQHFDRDYLRTEFVTILNKLDPAWPHASKLKLLLDKNNSLDNVFDAVCVPVFLTYDSPVMAAHRQVSDAFKKEFAAEVKKHYVTFAANTLPTSIVLHLFLLPMRSKKELQQEFDKRLKACQTILS